MKTFKNILSASLLSGAVLSLVLSSCQKEFNPKSYAPPKPPPSFSGYSKSVDIEPTHLVAYWPFNGDLKDSISGTAGTATGTTSFVKGVEGQGLSLSGTSYVLSDVPAKVKSLHSFTMSTWVNMPLNTNGAIGLIDIAHTQNFWGNMDLFFDNGGSDTSGVLKVHAYNDATSTSGVDGWEGGYHVSQPWGHWTQVVITYNDSNGTFIVYYDGNPAGNNTPANFTPLDWTGLSKMVFGTLQFQTNPSLTSATGSQGWAGYLQGTLDQVRVYDEVLSAPQVSALYN
ncbi:MAG: LamG domain-containing protein, partial [Bacteroidetes bacterium]|nr:LamG domain-containing protein [Bacteroidota bacterium]